jgi:hypothetical protein
MRQISFLLVLLLIAFNVQGQDRITVYGSVSDEFGTSIPTPTIVNASTSQRISATLAGTFTATINRSDSLFVFYPGFKAEYLKFTDSIPQAEYIVYVRLRRPSVELQEAIIRADKPMFEIKRDISQLEKKNPNTYKKVSPMSPITLLWQKFSAKEKEKRAVAELEYQQEIKQIVADLLRQYVKNDIIEYLDDEQIRLVADDVQIPGLFPQKGQ